MRFAGAGFGGAMRLAGGVDFEGFGALGGGVFLGAGVAFTEAFLGGGEGLGTAVAAATLAFFTGAGERPERLLSFGIITTAF